MDPREPELEEWMRLYTPRLLGVARAFAHGPEEAEDILQEVWIRAYDKAPALPKGASIGAWLYTVTLNEGRSRLRRRRRRRRLREVWRSEERGESDETAAPEISDELYRARLWRAVAELPSLQREALILRTVEGLSTAQAAAALGRAEGTVKASLHRALRALRSKLGTGGATPSPGGQEPRRRARGR